MKLRRTQVVIAAMATIVAGCVAWYASMECRKEQQFLGELDLVGFSTSMIAMPQADKERHARQRAAELGIDLFDAYQSHQDLFVRYNLAWMLITAESPAYYDFARENVDSIPWHEVVIWSVRRKQESISAAYREKLRNLIIASPLPEAKLIVAQWHRAAGRDNDAEDAFYAAMKSREWWVALDAAEELVKTKRHQNEAVNFLLSFLRDADYFVPRAASILTRLYGVDGTLNSLVDACDKEAKKGPNRKLLVEKLSRLVKAQSGVFKPAVNPR